MINRRRMQGAYMTPVNGWIRAHLEGTPGELGYQNGVLLGDQILRTLEALQVYVRHTWEEWSFFRKAAVDYYIPKLPEDISEEIHGIVEGLRDVGIEGIDVVDLVALNGYFDTAYSYYYWLKHKRGEPPESEEHGGCSAFIATGSVTKDGGIVLGHNTWFPYMIARWNVILDITPASGFKFIMQCYPGTVYSGTDVYISEAGLLASETTITGMFTFRPEGTPYFVRARKAIQYANTIDEWVDIMLDDNNGGYANDWLLGDAYSGEILMLELGTWNYQTWRTRDGYFVGCNVAQDPDVRKETVFNYDDPHNTCNIRRKRWLDLIEDYKGGVDVHFAKKALADHYDMTLGVGIPSRGTLCGHVEVDGRGLPEWEWGPFYPGGAFDGIVTSSELAQRGNLWAHWGKPCDAEYNPAQHLMEHPEYIWQKSHAFVLTPYPWTLFTANWSPRNQAGT